MTMSPANRRLLTARVQALAADRLDDLAEQLASKARANVRALRDPDRRGPPELERSIHVRADGPWRRCVVADAPHAAFVEFGTQRMAAQPFLRPAARDRLK